MGEMGNRGGGVIAELSPVGAGLSPLPCLCPLLPAHFPGYQRGHRGCPGRTEPWFQRSPWFHPLVLPLSQIPGGMSSHLEATRP